MKRIPWLVAQAGKRPREFYSIPKLAQYLAERHLLGDFPRVWHDKRDVVVFETHNAKEHERVLRRWFAGRGL